MIALLFDLDGTLVDTEALHFQAFAEILAEEGRTIDVAEFETHFVGAPNAAIAARYFPGRDDAAQILERKEAMVRARLSAGLTPIAGAREVLGWAATEGHPVAAVTNAPRLNAEAYLTALGLADTFGTLIIGDETGRPKPDPLPYLMAMEALAAAPLDSIVFEDSRAGCRAGAAAGATVFGMTTTLAPAALLEAGAHRTIADFTDPVLWEYLEQRKGSP